MEYTRAIRVHKKQKNDPPVLNPFVLKVESGELAVGFKS